MVNVSWSFAVTNRGVAGGVTKFVRAGLVTR